MEIIIAGNLDTIPSISCSHCTTEGEDTTVYY